MKACAKHLFAKGEIIAVGIFEDLTIDLEEIFDFE